MKSIGAMAALRSATWAAHQRLEMRVDINARFSDPSLYRRHLEKMWGFCAALEQRLRGQDFGGALGDYESRRKQPLLTQDLIALGADAGAVARLPRCETLPQYVGAAAAFGGAYVLEGATLGGRTLLPVVQRCLGLSANHGAAFLASYGDEVGSKWRKFGAALDAWCDTPERCAEAAVSAMGTFAALDEWLCGSP